MEAAEPRGMVPTGPDEVADARPLLDLEDPSTTDPEVAYHWVLVYDELLRLTTHLTERAHDDGLGASAELDSARRRFAAGRAYWVERQLALRGVHIDDETRVLSLGGRSVLLTGRELEVMRALIRHAGRPQPARRLLYEAWGEPGLTTEQMRLYISRLRTKLRDVPGLWITHEPRRGYAISFGTAVAGDGAGPGGAAPASPSPQA